MNVEKLKKLLSDVKKGKTDTVRALDILKTLPFEETEFATLDTHRSLRQGFPEVILGQGKSHSQIASIIKIMKARNENTLVTRIFSFLAFIIFIMDAICEWLFPCPSMTSGKPCLRERWVSRVANSVSSKGSVFNISKALTVSVFPFLTSLRSFFSFSTFILIVREFRVESGEWRVFI